MTFEDLPTLNAILNFFTLCLLCSGFYLIKQGRRRLHKKVMLSALATSMLFLTSYVIYHINAGSQPYPYHDWTRPVYFAILIPHVCMAILLIPCVLIVVRHAWKENFRIHKKLAHWVFPMWIFVSFTGIIIYLMLYRL